MRDLNYMLRAYHNHMRVCIRAKVEGYTFRKYVEEYNIFNIRGYEL